MTTPSLNRLLAMYCDAFDISVCDKEYLVTVFDKVALFFDFLSRLDLLSHWIAAQSH